MRSFDVSIVAVMGALLFSEQAWAFGKARRPNNQLLQRPLQSSSSANRRMVASTERRMFSGSGTPGEDDPEKDKQMEAAAKQMGFTLKEYKLVMKMQKQLADDVSALRVTGGSEDKGVTVELDGNSPPNHLVVSITDDGKALGKAGLEKELLAAIKAATEASKKGQEEAIKKMNADIGESMKAMGGK